MNCDFFDSRKNVCTINDKPCCQLENAPAASVKECSTSRVKNLIEELKPRRARKLANRFAALMASFQLS